MSDQPTSWQTPAARAVSFPGDPRYPVGAPPLVSSHCPVQPPVPARPRRDWRIIGMAVAAALLALAGVVVYLTGNPKAVGAPRARLESALVATNSTGTADLTMDIKVSFEGVTISATATGTVDFTARSASLDMNVLGQTLTLVDTNNVLFMKLGKLVSSKIPGKTWVQVPVRALSGAHDGVLFTTNDPAKVMGALLRLGATVTPLGTATIDGSQDQGYRIRLTLATLEAHASELPSSLRSLFATAKDLPKGTATMSATMYVDPAGQLQATHVLLTAQQTGHPVTASVDLTMSSFGVPGPPAPPPVTRTVTYLQLKASLGSGTLPFTLPGSTHTTA